MMTLNIYNVYALKNQTGRPEYCRIEIHEASSRSPPLSTRLATRAILIHHQHTTVIEPETMRVVQYYAYA